MAESEFARKTLPQLITQTRNDLLARLNSDDVLRRQDAEVNARVMAALTHSVLGVINYFATNLLPDLADSEWLARHASFKRCPRKLAQVSSGFVRWDSVSNGLTVLAGDQLQTDDGLEFVVTATTVSSGGLLRAPVTAVEAGSAGNVDDGTPLRLITPIVGLPSEALADTLGAGADIEDLEVWRARVLARHYWVPHGGAGPDYENSALSVAGVTRAWFLRRLMGAGTVTVAVATDDALSPLPAPAVLDAVRAEIESWAPVTQDDLYIISPLAGDLDLTLSISPDTPEIRAAITASLRDYLRREGGLQREEAGPITTLPLSRISEAISLAQGEFSHQLISPAANVVFARTELPILGTITWV